VLFISVLFSSSIDDERILTGVESGRERFDESLTTVVMASEIAKNIQLIKYIFKI
jgi:hypothetical protein